MPMFCGWRQKWMHLRLLTKLSFFLSGAFAEHLGDTKTKGPLRRHGFSLRTGTPCDMTNIYHMLIRTPNPCMWIWVVGCCRSTLCITEDEIGCGKTGDTYMFIEHSLNLRSMDWKM
jgi:hypothetical protein